jgi:predicted double-glycine peptidase
MKPTLLDLNPFKETQSESMCGPASLKIVLDYYGVQETEEELAKLCGTTVELGTSDEQIKKAAESLGFRVEIKEECELEDIQMWLDKKVPVIVDWFTRGHSGYTDEDIADGHYSVVAGLDADYIYLQDPELGGIRKLKREDFLTVWFDFYGRYIAKDNLIIRQLIAVYR